MRRIALWLTGTVAVLVLLFGYRTSTAGPGTPGRPAAVAQAPGVVLAPSTGTASGTAGTDIVVNGAVADTRWGPVQVQVQLRGGKIVEVTVLQQPSGNRRDVMINGYALPQLRAEVLSAQSANIDTVGGATVTSDGYVRSLQSALDAAHVTG